MLITSAENEMPRSACSSKVLLLRIAGIWLLMATALPSSAGNASLRETIARIIPKVSQQLSASVLGSKVAVTAACISSVCLLNFSAPADISELDLLLPDTTLVITRGENNIFLEPSLGVEKSVGLSKTKKKRSGVAFERFVIDREGDKSASNRGLIRFNSSTKLGGFTGNMETAFIYPISASLNADDIGIKMRGRAGISGLLVDNGKNKMSYMFLFVNMSAGGSVSTQRIMSHLLHYKNETLHATTLGYEYLSTDISPLTDDDKDKKVSSLRTKGVAIYRLGLNLPLLEHFQGKEAINIKLKLNSSMLWGNAGSISFSNTDEGKDWTEGFDLSHSLYHSAGASLRTKLAGGRIKLILTGSIRNTIRGSIRREQQRRGVFSATNTVLMLLSSIDLIPAHRVSLEANLSRFNQTVEVSFFNGKQFETDTWRTWGKIAIKKSF